MKLFLSLALALATSSAFAQERSQPISLPKKTIDLDARFMTAVGQPGSSRFDSTLRQWDGSNGFPSIVVQSPMGACQSFAMTAWMEYVFYHRTGQVVDLSEKYTAYNLLRYFIDEFYDSAKGEYVARGFGDGQPTLGSGVAMYMIDSFTKTGMIPNAVYPLGDMNATSGAIQMDLPVYKAIFEESTTKLKRDEYLAKLDESFLGAPPAKFFFKIPFTNFASGTAETKVVRTPEEISSYLALKREAFTVFHNKDMNPAYVPELRGDAGKQLTEALAKATKEKKIRELTVDQATLRTKILRSLDRRMVVMVAAFVWMGDWADSLVSKGGGGHAMVIVGYQLQKADDGTEKLFFKLRNSWGTSIGAEGYNIVEDNVLLPNVLEITTLSL